MASAEWGPEVLLEVIGMDLMPRVTRTLVLAFWSGHMESRMEMWPGFGRVHGVEGVEGVDGVDGLR